MKVALVHDSLVVRGGAERVFLAMCDLYPDAPIFTSMFRPDTTLAGFMGRDVRPLWPDRLPLGARSYRAAFLAIAAAFEQLKLPGFDLVLSSSSQFAKSAGAEAGARVCYCHTVPRFLWPLGSSSQREGRMAWLAGASAAPLLRPMDRRAASRVTQFAANSRQTAGRIARFYAREATVIHPPVDTETFRPVTDAREDFYLTVGRLVAYKGFDDAVATCVRTGRRLVVVGTGRDEARLRSLAGPTVRFAGSVSESELISLYSRARAVLLPGDDDWGMVAAEANACGCPAIGRAVGGNLETIADGQNGLLYQPVDDGLERAIQRLEASPLNPATLRAAAERYSAFRFREQTAELVASAMAA